MHLQVARQVEFCYTCSAMKTFRPCLAEFLGTFYLCFPGIAAILATSKGMDPGAALVAIALAHGLGLTLAISNFGGISGAHVNPAVTCGFLITGRIKPGLAVTYIVSQLLGATTAAGFCRVIFPVEVVTATHLGLPLPAPWASTGVVLLTEFILTYLLMTSVFGTAVDERGKVVKIGGFGIGLTVAFDILAGGPVTGASMNPARSFGPALELMQWQWHWAYWLAPVAGACAAALVYEHVLLERAKAPVAEPNVRR